MSTFTIRPYRKGDKWFFDDLKVGLLREPLTDGVPEILHYLYDLKKINEQDSYLNFSSVESKLSDITLTFFKLRNNGSVYRLGDKYRFCWLCPALMRYYDKPPKNLYVWLSEEEFGGGEKYSPYRLQYPGQRYLFLM